MQTHVQTNVATTTCVAPPPIIFLFVTLLFTISATALLCVSINTDHWEEVTWDHKQLQKITNNTNQTLHYYLDGRVAKLNVKCMYYMKLFYTKHFII